MSKQVLGGWNFHNLAELKQAVDDAVLDARLAGRSPDLVQIENCHRMALVEEPLSDNSKVLNLYIHPGEPDSETGKDMSFRPTAPAAAG